MARPDTQTRLATDMIRQRLLHGDHTGRLPGERQLAVELGLSRPTVRKAIQQLCDEGLLQRGPTGRIAASATRDGEARRPLIALLHHGQIQLESALWRDGVYAAAEARGAGVRTISYAHYGDPAVSAALEGYDGVFLLPIVSPIPDPLLKRLRADSPRVVVLDQDATARGLRSVIMFPFASGDKLLDHLRALGHRRIDCVNVQPLDPVIQARIEGWRAYLRRHGLDGELVGDPAQGTPEPAYRLVSARLRRGKTQATAFFGVTAHAAIGAMRALHEKGLHIGRDVSVCAVNDEGLGPYLVPSLTCIQTPPRARYLRKAVDWMIGRVEWARPTLVQPAEAPLFVGESTGPAGK